MNIPPSPTGIRAGGGSDPPIRRSPRLENGRASSPAPAPAQDGSTVPAPAQGSSGVGPAQPCHGGPAQPGRGGPALPGRGGPAPPRRAPPGHGGRAVPARGARGSGRRFTIPELESLNETISDVLPIGPTEWELVAERHGQHYPEHNRCSVNLRRKFKEMYSVQVPTGDPHCPEHIRTAKHLHRAIQNRSDADNLDGTEVDLGVEEEASNDEEKNNDDNADREGQREPDEIARRLFQGSAARPLVRTPVSAGRTRNGGAADLTAVVMASIAASTRNEQAEREERRQDRRMNQMLMIGMLSAINPAAAAAMQPLQNHLVQQMQNDLLNQEADDTSISNSTN